TTLFRSTPQCTSANGESAESTASHGSNPHPGWTPTNHYYATSTGTGKKVLTITSQVILLNTQTNTSTTVSWIILILSSFILAYAIQLLVKKNPTSRD